MYIKAIVRNSKMMIITLLIVVALSLLSPLFLTWGNISNIFTQVSIYGFAAVGMTFAIICGEMDLSIGAVIAFSGMLLVTLEKSMPVGVAILIVLLAGAAIGLTIGFLVTKQKVNSFITTMAAMLVFKSLALLISNSPLRRANKFLKAVGNTKVGIFPLSILILFALILIGQYVLKQTRLGRNMYATGGNINSARLAGIDVDFYKIIAFALTSFMAAFAGVMLTARLGSASAIAADDAAISVISSIVIGGTSLSGGKGSMFRTMNGFFMIGIIVNAINLLRIFSYYQQAIMGLVLIIVVTIDVYTNIKRAKRTSVARYKPNK